MSIKQGSSKVQIRFKYISIRFEKSSYRFNLGVYKVHFSGLNKVYKSKSVVSVTLKVDFTW